jgi:copper(I)-binding protein
MRWLHLVGLILALTPIAAATEGAGVFVRDAWVRETPSGVAVMAGYMLLQNNTSRPQVLMAARSSGFETVMIHRTIVKEGLTRMEHLSQIELLPNASLLFAPGGYHLMLLRPKRALHAGDRVDITLEFRGGLAIPVAYEVRK